MGNWGAGVGSTPDPPLTPFDGDFDGDNKVDNGDLNELLGAWGDTVTQLGSGDSASSAYGFTGRRWDPESGLWYYRARYYDSQAGRFVGRDPIGQLSHTIDRSRSASQTQRSAGSDERARFDRSHVHHADGSISLDLTPGVGERAGQASRTQTPDLLTILRLYQYVDSAPLIRADPLGLVSFGLEAGIGGHAGPIGGGIDMTMHFGFSWKHGFTWGWGPQLYCQVGLGMSGGVNGSATVSNAGRVRDLEGVSSGPFIDTPLVDFDGSVGNPGPGGSPGTFTGGIGPSLGPGAGGWRWNWTPDLLGD